MMHVERLTIPPADAFYLSDVKDHARVDFTDDDYDLREKTRAAVQELEHYAQLALLTQTIRVTLDVWPESAILIEKMRSEAEESYFCERLKNAESVISLNLGLGLRRAVASISEQREVQ